MKWIRALQKTEKPPPFCKSGSGLELRDGILKKRQNYTTFYEDSCPGSSRKRKKLHHFFLWTLLQQNSKKTQNHTTFYLPTGSLGAHKTKQKPHTF